MTNRLVGEGTWRSGWVLACVASLIACSQEMPLGASEASVAASASPVAAPAPAAAPAAQMPVDLSGGVAPGFAVNTVLAPDRAIEAGDYVWNADGAPAARLKIVVDIAAQRLYVYRGGVEIGRSSIIWGSDEKPTPTGLFPILEKRRDHVSNLYDAEMPYMMRLTWDGIALHGAEVDDDYATHGCVGLPDDFAALLFEEAKIGDQVLITNGWMRETYAAAAPAAPEEFVS